MSISYAIFAAGCFWGVQAAFDSTPGVHSTVVGYIGGELENPSYERVCKGDTNHAEAVEIKFDEKQISYEQLLDKFFTIHDPTTKNRQGWDIGSQYRSAIFYTDENQKKQALVKIAELNKSGKFKKPIVTEVLPATRFYNAEEYHQKYLFKKGKASCSGCTSPVPSPEELKSKLSAEQYNILINKGTEKPFTGKYLNNHEDGTYTCAACGQPIFASADKFDSGSGWPSFDKSIPGSVKLKKDFSHFMIRTEVVCSRCGSHLGHIFHDGPTNTGERFCINSGAMNFEKE